MDQAPLGHADQRQRPQIGLHGALEVHLVIELDDGFLGWVAGLEAMREAEWPIRVHGRLAMVADGRATISRGKGQGKRGGMAWLVSCGSVQFLEIARPPALIEESLTGAVKPHQRKPSLARDGAQEVGFGRPGGTVWPEIRSTDPSAL
ncbi:MAG: hypothetical protein JKP98_11970 [Rhodobacteraceae bacterium]|nr:hypothetical protein [Paracoccaceae bacterium]